MKRPAGIPFLLLLTAALLCLTILPAQAHWSAINDSATDSYEGIWGSSSTDVYVVGGHSIRHYDGTSWSYSLSDWRYYLYGIWGSSADNVYAVGYYYDSLPPYIGRSLILAYDGENWVDTGFGAASRPLYGIWGSSAADVFAVGSYGIIDHYDGSDWSHMDNGTGQALNSVWGSSAADVFAVGYSGRIAHYDGTAWSDQASGTTQPLHGVWGTSATNVYATNSTVRHYDGSAWTDAGLVPVVGAGNIFTGIWGSSASDIFVVGYKSLGAIVHYDGSTWRSMVSNAPTRLVDVWGTSATDVFAVGYYGSVLHYDGEGLTVTRSGTGSGTVTSGPAGIDCGLTCTQQLGFATRPVLSTVPADGSYFAGWSGGGCSGAGDCTVLMLSDTEITAQFCEATIIFGEQSFSAAGGDDSGSITTDSSCPWDGYSTEGWITVTADNGTGSGTIHYTVAPNIGPARSGEIHFAGSTYTITQADGCIFSIAPESEAFDKAGGSGAIALTASDNACTWVAEAGSVWITITSADNGTGSDNITYTVASNEGPERNDNITVAGKKFLITQANGCPDTDGDGRLGGLCLEDCDDGNAAVYQLLTGYADGDADGYGAGASTQLCSGASLPPGYAAASGDCDDANSAIHPGAAEGCNGKDDDCDGVTDNHLSDAPASGMGGCWDLPGTCCSYSSPITGKTTTWCAPSGATCSGMGSLSTPCFAGTLVCGGASGWQCQNAAAPQPESCDNVDNDCNGIVDDGDFPGEGVACGTDIGACTVGATLCSAGEMVCSGIQPSAEICNGIDDDCDGETDEGCTITTLEELQKIGSGTDPNYTLAGHYVLTADIDATSVTFTAIGSCASPFTGTFDGAGHVIRSLHVAGSECVGLFGSTEGAELRNVVLDNATVSGNGDAGGIAGRLGGTMQNCFVSGTVSGGAQNIGGIAGYAVAGSTIETSCSSAAVSGLLYIGGIAGRNEGGITNSCNTGQITGWGLPLPGFPPVTITGGLTGHNSGAVSFCYNSGAVNVVGTNAAVAGVNAGTITATYWDNETSGVAYGIGGGTSLDGVFEASTARMRQQETFEGWNFTDTWCILGGITYPVLQWLSAASLPQDDAYTAYGSDGITVPAPGVLANDSAVAAAAAHLVNPPAHGSLLLLADGAFFYEPDPGYSGSDNFTYNAGSCSIATVTITVVECAISISPASQAYAAAGGTSDIAVTATNSDCPWQAAADAGWITFPAGATGTGSAAVSYSVAANTGAARSATITIAGQNCTISQAGATTATTTTTTIPGEPCTLTVVPDRIQKLLFADERSLAAHPDEYRRLLTGVSQRQAVDIDVIIALLQLFQYTGPFKSFVIIGQEGTVFARADWPQWSPEGLRTLMKMRVGKRAMVALVFINPFLAKAGEYEVSIGDCTGTMTVEGL